MKTRKRMFFYIVGLLFVIQSLTITSVAAADLMNEENTPTYLSTTRVLFEDDFEGDSTSKWDVTSSSIIKFENGKVNVIGGGPENRLGTKTKINANKFVIDFDYWRNAGNSAAAFKVGFKATDNFGTRYQITYQEPQATLALEKGAASNAGEVIQKITNFSLPVNTGNTPHHFRIVVDNDQVTVIVNGQQKLTATDSGIGSSPKGKFMFASQYPNQDYSIDNVKITTDEVQTGTQYHVTLKTKTDGVENTIGGTLTADTLSGYEGDTIKLSVSTNRGYIFNGYTSFLTDTGAPTDGLLTITDNIFELNSKTGNVTIVANFITKPIDPNVIFEDDFFGPFNEHSKYLVRDLSNIQIENQELKIATASSDPNYILIPNSQLQIDEAKKEGYSIEFDAKKANQTAGTVQVAFRAGNDISARYVFVMNGNTAFIRYINTTTNENTELAKANYTFHSVSRKIKITVQKGQVSVTSNDTPLISYTLPTENQNWSSILPAAAFINMTVGADVLFDNITIKRIKPKSSINVVVKADNKEDKDYLCGAATVNLAQAAAGETITLTAIPKAGYQFVNYTILGETITNNTYTIPDNFTQEELTIYANFVSYVLREGKSFYIDPVNGNDSNNGESPSEAFQTLQKIRQSIFVPGDKILLKAGSAFHGENAELKFQGSGTKEKPIVVSSYGGQELPKLNGQGKLTTVVTLNNQEYITIENLEITNLAPEYNTTFELNQSNNRDRLLRGVNVFARDFGVVHNIYLKNLYIHDINGNLGSKWNGGIFFDITGNKIDGKPAGIPTKYDDILIENCKIEKVDRSAIKLVSSAWANQSLTNAPGVPLYWYPSTNVKVRSNIISQVGGDGITVRDTDKALIEYNLVRDCRYQNTGYNAGIWPFEATNTVVQYNEAYRTHGTQDGQGFDCDHIASYTTMQYNYSHDNSGGFMLIMNGFPHTAPTVRYNISQNDKDKTFEFSRGTPAGTMIYNNTIYSNSVLTGRGGVFDLANSAAGTGNREVFIFNNIFYYPQGQAIYCGEAGNNKDKFKLYQNAYYGGIVPPAEEESPITADPKLKAVGTAPEQNNGNTPATGKYLTNQLEGYQLLEGSPLINAGATVAEIVAKYNGTITDRRNLSPSQIHELAKAGNSIDFAMGENFPNIEGVVYDKDFFGNPLSYQNTKPDIGAMEFQGAGQTTNPNVTPPPTTTPNPEGIFSDSFQNAFDTTKWTQKGNGTITVGNGKLTLKGSAGGASVVSKIEMPKADYEINLDFSIADPTKNGNYWIGFRHNLDTNARYALRYHNKDGFYFAKLTGEDNFGNNNTGIKNLTSPYAFLAAANETYHLKIRVEGNQMTAWLNNTQILSCIDETQAYLTGGISLWGNWMYEANFSNLIVTQYLPAPKEADVIVTNQFGGVYSYPLTKLFDVQDFSKAKCLLTEENKKLFALEPFIDSDILFLTVKNVESLEENKELGTLTIQVPKGNQNLEATLHFITSNQLTPVCEVETVPIKKENQFLSDAKLNGKFLCSVTGEEINGTLNWIDTTTQEILPDTTAIIKGNPYTWKFNPNNWKLYKEVMDSIIL